MATNHQHKTSMEGPVIVRSAPLQWMKRCELSGHHVCSSYLIHRKSAFVCYSSATALQNNFLFTKGNSPISWANGDVRRFELCNSYIMPVIVKSIKKSRNIPQSKRKKVLIAFTVTMFALMCIQRNCNHWRRQNNWSNSSLTKNLLSFLKG